MFKNEILVSTHLTSAFSAPFFLLRLSLSDSSLVIEIEALCWKLSRRFRIACFHPSPSSIFVIYQRSQAQCATQVVGEIKETLAVINVEEEEVCSAPLLATAFECWLRSLMLEKSWKCIGDSTFVQSTFAGNEEKNHLPALNVRVQSEKGGLVFIVSPDAIWFSRDKISDLVTSRSLQRFSDDNITVVEKDSLLTACTVLPSLYNGHIVELSKLPPATEKFEKLEELWLIKHGLNLSSDYYIKAHFTYGVQESNQWFPAANVLRGSGLYPAPQTARASMAVNALKSFIKTLECSDFFCQGLLKVKDVSSLQTPIMQSAWKVVGSACVDNKNIISALESAIHQRIVDQNLHLILDFRTQKPAVHYISANRMMDHDINGSAPDLTREEMIEARMAFHDKPSIPKLLNVVQISMKAPPLGQSQAYQRDIYGEILDLCPPGQRTGEHLQQRNVDSLSFSSKGLREKVISDTLNHSSSLKVKKAEKNNAFSKRTVDKNDDNKEEGKSQPRLKKKANPDGGNISDVTLKVHDFYARGKLQCLTIPDLKCFLASKKLKVGGKKEELIQRVTAILG